VTEKERKDGEAWFDDETPGSYAIWRHWNGEDEKIAAALHREWARIIVALINEKNDMGPWKG
jgi:hypothetical protein